MMNPAFEPDDLDRMLRQAMAARPMPAVKIDLAHVAMQKARSSPAEAALVMVSRVNRWNRVATFIAVLLIVVISGWVFHSHVAAGGFESWSTQTTSDTSSTTTSDTSITATEWMLGGAAMALGALVVVLCQRAISPNDEWMVLGLGAANG